MAKVEIVDQTMRDGQQSLWGMQMQAGMALPVTPLIDKVGYDVVDLVGSSMFEIMVRNFSEDPWEGLDLIPSPTRPRVIALSLWSRPILSRPF